MRSIRRLKFTALAILAFGLIAVVHFQSKGSSTKLTGGIIQWGSCNATLPGNEASTECSSGPDGCIGECNRNSNLLDARGNPVAVGTCYCEEQLCGNNPISVTPRCSITTCDGRPAGDYYCIDGASCRMYTCTGVIDPPSEFECPSPSTQEHCGFNSLSGEEVCCASGNCCTGSATGEPYCCPIGPGDDGGPGGDISTVGGPGGDIGDIGDIGNIGGPGGPGGDVGGPGGSSAASSTSSGISGSSSSRACINSPVGYYSCLAHCRLAQDQDFPNFPDEATCIANVCPVLCEPVPCENDSALIRACRAGCVTDVQIYSYECRQSCPERCDGGDNGGPGGSIGSSTSAASSGTSGSANSSVKCVGTACSSRSSSSLSACTRNTDCGGYLYEDVCASLPPNVCSIDLGGILPTCLNGVCAERDTQFTLYCDCASSVSSQNSSTSRSVSVSSSGKSTSKPSVGFCCAEGFCDPFGSCAKPYESFDACAAACGKSSVSSLNSVSSQSLSSSSISSVQSSVQSIQSSETSVSSSSFIIAVLPSSSSSFTSLSSSSSFSTIDGDSGVIGDTGGGSSSSLSSYSSVASSSSSFSLAVGFTFSQQSSIGASSLKTQSLPFDIPYAPGPAICGDGAVQRGEQCDGAEVYCINGWTCDSTNCVCVEPFDIPYAPGPAICGDGAVQRGEQCDGALAYCLDGWTCDSQKCLCKEKRTVELAIPVLISDISAESSSIANAVASRSEFSQPLVAAASLCGNGVLETPEECDDSNRRSGDGCNDSCLLEIGICGDGKVQQLLGEQCEQSTHDSSLPYGCRNCRFFSTSCGDGKLDPGEECDKGPLNSTSANADCRPDCSLSRCGDGILDSTELCDDGNRRAGDGCDSYCRKETTLVASDTTQAVSDERSAMSSVAIQQFNNQQIPFPYAQPPTPYALPFASLQPLIQQTPQTAQSGPAAVAIIGAGAAAGLSWVRRRRK